MTKFILVKFEVKDSAKEFYYPPSICQGIGYIWDKDDDHIWIKKINSLLGGKSYISSTSRYILTDIILEYLDDYTIGSNL